MRSASGIRAEAAAVTAIGVASKRLTACLLRCVPFRPESWLSIHQRLHGKTLWGVRILEACQHALAIALAAVLAQFPFAFEPVDSDLDADDAVSLAFNVIGGGIGDTPRMLELCLLLRDETVEMAEQPRGLVMHGQRTVGVDDGVVPRRNDTPVLLLCGIPRRRDVLMRAGEDRERVDGGAGITPLRVGTSDVSAQHAILRF